MLARLAAIEQRHAGVDLVAPINRLVDAVLALRDDIEVAIGDLRVETTSSMDKVLTEQVGRFGSLEARLTSLHDEVAIERLEASMRDMAEDTSGLRADVRRSFDRVLHEISTTEASIKGEVRAIDGRLAGIGDDLRLVRSLRDGLEALASGVDAVRQLAARSATAAQMNELAGDLSNVLAEIEAARSEVLAVDHQVGLAQAGAIEVTTSPDVEDLERRVNVEMAELGSRIEAIADRALAATPQDPVAARLRSLATGARQLSAGIAEDLRARRKRARKPVSER